MSHLDRLMTNPDDLPPKPRDPRAVEDHRHAMFMELRFTEHQADVLVDSRDHSGVLIHWSEAKALLDSGCSHETAFDILSSPKELHGE